MENVYVWDGINVGEVFCSYECVRNLHLKNGGEESDLEGYWWPISRVSPETIAETVEAQGHKCANAGCGASM